MIYTGVWCIRHNMFFYMDVYFLEKLAINVDTLPSPPHFKSKSKILGALGMDKYKSDLQKNAVINQDFHAKAFIIWSFITDAMTIW